MQDYSLQEEHRNETQPRSGEGPARRSLTDDMRALLDDGKTYVEAEAAYQKSRAKLVANRGARGAAFGIVALLLANTALISLCVGLIFTLAPMLTPLGATALVVACLLILAGIFGMFARAKFRGITQVSEGPGR